MICHFNSLKYACLIGKLAKQPIEPISLGSGQIELVDSLQLVVAA